MSTCGKRICEELFEQYRKAGITDMEISVDNAEYKNLNFDDIQLWAEKYHVALWSLHLPYFYSEIELSKPAYHKSLEQYEDIIRKAVRVGINNFVVHPSAEPVSDDERAERINRAKESLSLLAEIAKKYHAVIAVENLPRSCLGKNSNEIAELISGNSDLRVCLDTNHLVGEAVADFIRKIGNKIITTHVSDYDLVNEQHWLPGEGKIDWQSTLSALKEVGYDGPWLYEIGFDCPKTLSRSRKLTCEDFVKNSGELFRNEPISFLTINE